MSSTRNPNKNTALALNQKVSAGVDKYFAKVKSITIGGTTYTPASLKAVLQAEDDASKDVDSTRAQLTQQVATHRTAKATAQSMRSAIRTYILNTYGKAALQMLGDFGMVAPKPLGPQTTEAKAKGVANAKATREGHDAATVATPSQSAPATSPVQVAQATQPAQIIATHS